MHTEIPMKRLQAADKMLGRFACVLLQPARWLRPFRSVGTKPERILLIKFWGIGSLQLLTPAVKSLRRRHPGAELCLLTLNQNERFARGLNVFDEIRTFDVRGGGWLRIFLRIAALMRQLRSARFDRVYDFEFFTHFSAIVSLLTGAREVHGFAAPAIWRGGIHTRVVPFNRYWHVARNFRALAEGETGEDVTFEEVAAFPIETAPLEGVRDILARSGFAPGSPYVVLNPNAGQLSLERRWPTANFAELARRLISEDGARVVLIGSRSEQEYTASVAAATGDVPSGFLANVAGELSIDELAALLAGASCVVTNDSGPMHVSAALGTPTVGLFGPETPMMYAPIGERARVMWEPPVCSPCINVHDNKVATCIHGRPECLVNISVESVLEEARFAVCGSILKPVARRVEESTSSAEPETVPGE